MQEIQVLFNVLSGQEIRNNCFIYGRSISNQRIDAWWGILRRQVPDWGSTFSTFYVNVIYLMMLTYYTQNGRSSETTYTCNNYVEPAQIATERQP